VTRRRFENLSAIEEAILVWQEASVPWNTQIGVPAPALDAERVRAAYNATLAHHPLTSCYVERDERGGCHWIHDSEADIGEIEVLDCPDEASLQRVRIEQLDIPVPMDRAPLIRAVIARCPTEDILVSCISHVLCDGLSMLRLLRSVGRAYRGEFDPPPAVDIATAHRVLDPAPVTSWSALTERWTNRISRAASTLAERSRLAPSGGSTSSGFGLIRRVLATADVTRARRAHRASFDAYAMAGLHVTIERWNASHDAPCERVGVTQGINLRPDEWWDDVVINLAAFASVMTDPDDRRDLDTALPNIVPQLDHDLRREQARDIASAARAARLVPVALRRQALASAPANQFDTCVISNAGVILDPPRFVDDDQPALWACTPAMPAVGMTIGIGTIGDELQFNCCFRRERFDDQGASDFLDAFIATLTNG